MKKLFIYSLFLISSIACTMQDEEFEPTLDRPISFKSSKGEYVEKIILTWSESPKAANYEVLRFDSLKNDYSKIGETSNSFYIDSTIRECGKYFYYKIRIYNSKSKYSEYSDYDYGFIANFKTPLLNISPNLSDSYIKLEWDTILGADEFFIYRSNNENENYVLIDSIDTSTYIDNSVSSDQKYYYKIRANNKTLGMTEYSNYIKGYRLEKYSSSIPILNINDPESIVCDNNGNIYVSSWGDSNVKEYTENGNFTKIVIADFTSGLLWLGNNQIAAVKSHDNKIAIYNTIDGSKIREFGNSGSGDGEFDYVRRMTIDEDGNFYVTDYSNHRIQKFDNKGNYVAKWTSHSPIWNLENPPFGILHLNNMIIVTSTSNTQFFSKNGTYIKTMNIPSYSLSKDSKGYLYITSGNKILKYNQDGELLARFGSFELEAAFGIDVNNNGDVFVADYLNGKVFKYLKEN